MWAFGIQALENDNFLLFSIFIHFTVIHAKILQEGQEHFYRESDKSTQVGPKNVADNRASIVYFLPVHTNLI